MHASHRPNLDLPPLDGNSRLYQEPQAHRSWTTLVPRPEHVQQFKELYRQKFGASLSDKQALEQLISLLTIFQYQQENSSHKADQ